MTNRIISRLKKIAVEYAPKDGFSTVDNDIRKQFEQEWEDDWVNCELCGKEMPKPTKKLKPGEHYICDECEQTPPNRLV
jgi:formylmethanofuran dehydrogenase subunit E